MHLASDSAINIFFTGISERPTYTYRWAFSDTACHQHMDFYEFILVTQGTFSHTFNHNTETLEKGSLLLFDKKQKHRLDPSSPNSIHFALCISANYFENLLHTFHFEQELFHSSKCIQGKVDLVSFEHLFSLANGITGEGEKLEHVKLFFYNALSYLTNFSITASPDGKDVVDDICEKIRNFSYLTMNMVDVYKLYPYSAPTIIKNFKERMGVTPIRFQIDVKLDYAAQLLQESTLSTEQIISSLGFHSSSHFYELFKKRYGLTPNAYRNK